MTAQLAPQTVQRLVVSQFKRLTDLEIIPEAETPTVQITGRNAQGKSSVLDALETVFAGVDNRRTPKPIHDGATSARIVAETQDLVITRTFKTTAKGTTDSTLTVAAKDGARYGSPQKMMDELFGLVAVDPWAFATMSAKDQKALLLSLVALPFNLDALDAERAAFFAKRAEANKETRSLTARREAAEKELPPEGTATTETSAGDLIERIQDARRHADEIERAGREVREWSEEVEDLEIRLRDARERLAAAETKHDALEEKEAEDVDELNLQLRNLEDNNRQAREAAAAIAEAERLEALERAAAERAIVFDKEIRAIDGRKAEGLAGATFPVDGLGFTEDGITYQGQPFEQASTAERIRVSFAVATAKPGTMRVVLIRNGESLDSSNLELVGQLAAEAGFQVWVERVSEVRELGVFQLEDGRLA